MVADAGSPRAMLTERLQLRVTPQMMTDFQQFAREADMPFPEFLRHVLNQYRESRTNSYNFTG